MPRLKWTFSIDLDGVLCETVPPDKYEQARPIKENIDIVNRLYDKGYNIIVSTSRSWSTYDITKLWLQKHGVRYTDLCMAKVLAHAYIDDKNRTLQEVYEEFIVKSKDGLGQILT